MWSNLSRSHVGGEHTGRSHRSSMSMLDQVGSGHRDSKKEWNRTHWHCYHCFAAKEYKEMRTSIDNGSSYSEVDVFDQFVEVLEPFVGIFVLKVTAHGHDDMIGGETNGLEMKLESVEECYGTLNGSDDILLESEFLFLDGFWECFLQPEADDGSLMTTVRTRYVPHFALLEWMHPHVRAHCSRLDLDHPRNNSKISIQISRIQRDVKGKSAIRVVDRTEISQVYSISRAKIQWNPF